MGDGAAPTIVFFKVRDFELRWEYRLWKATEVLELVGVEVCALHLTKCFSRTANLSSLDSRVAAGGDGVAGTGTTYAVWVAPRCFSRSTIALPGDATGWPAYPCKCTVGAVGGAKYAGEGNY